MAYYPSCITDYQVCNKCYTSQSCTNCSDGNSVPPCSSFCNSGCNTICVSIQSFCKLGIEFITYHADVPKYTGVCQVKDEIIIRNWTAVYWNSIRDRLLKASTLGELSKQGTPPAFTKVVASPPPQTPPKHPENSLISAEKYNQMVDNLNHFRTTLSQVAKEDVIKAAHSMAINDGNNDARFKTTVCDVCNASAQNRNNCNCNCNCNCSCACRCTCACPCPCACSCSSGGRS